VAGRFIGWTPVVNKSPVLLLLFNYRGILCHFQQYFSYALVISFIGEMLVVHNSPVILWWSVLLGFNIPVNSISVIPWWSVLLVKCIMSTLAQLYCGGQIYWKLTSLSIVFQLFCDGQFYWRNGCCQQKPSYTVVVQFSCYFMPLSTIAQLYCGGQLYCCSMPLSTIAQLYCGGQFYWCNTTIINSSVILW
jgi:hypothetical protein